MSRTRLPAVEAVAELIRSGHELVERDDGTRLRIRTPCLLQLLIVHLHSSSGGRGGGHTAGSVPLNTQAWDLLVEIRTDAYSWAQLLDVDPKPYDVEDTPRAGKPVTPPVGKLLRAVAVKAETTARMPVADTILRLARRWKQQIEEIVAGQADQRSVRDAGCPACTTIQPYPADLIGPRSGPQPTRSVVEARVDGDGRTNMYRVPALAVVAGRDGDPPTIYCRACGWSSPLTAMLPGTETRRDDHRVDAEPGQAA